MKNLGWSISRVSEADDFSAELIDWGTVYGSGTGMAVVDGIVKNILAIADKHSIDVLAIEDYQYIPGKERGMFVVPALIGILKYVWYLRTGQEVVMVNAASWKTLVCGFGNASKLDVRENMTRFLPQQVQDQIKEEYSQKRNRGVQDCIDAIALGIYVCSLIANNRRMEQVTVHTKED